MQTLFVVMFWISLALTLYVAAVYPCLLGLLCRMRRSFAVRESARTLSDAELPALSVILPVFQDDRQLLDKLHNLLELDFPVDRIEVLVGCDPRDDLTADLVSTVNDSRVRKVHCDAPRNRADILNACLAAARHGVVMFADSNVRLTRETARRLAGHFTNPHVGCMHGLMTSTDADSLDAVRRDELCFGVTAGRDGTVAAYRAELLDPIPQATSDISLFAGLCVYRSGLEILFDGQATARRRSVLLTASPRGFSAVAERARRVAGMMHAIRFSGFSRGTLVLCSHLLRRVAPAFIIGAMLSNAVLAGDPFYLRLLLLHETVYVCLLVHLCLRSTKYWPFATSAWSNSQ